MFNQRTYQVVGSLAQRCVFAFHPFPIERGTGAFKDLSLNNQTATFMVSGVAAPATTTIGKYGREILLNGTTNQIQAGRDGVGDSTFLNVVFPFAVTIIFKRTNNTTNIQGVICKNSSTGGSLNNQAAGWWLACSRDAYTDATYGNGRVWLRWGATPNQREVVSPAATIPDGADETAVTVNAIGDNVAGNAKTLDLWVNGEVVASTSLTFAGPGGTVTGCYIGQFNFFGNFLGGSVSYAFIHKRSLKGHEITLLHSRPQDAFAYPLFRPDAGRLYYIGADQRTTGVNVALDAQLHDTVVDLAAHLALSEKPDNQIRKEAFMERAKMMISSITQKTEKEVEEAVNASY